MASSRLAYPSSSSVNAALNWSLAALRLAPSSSTRVNFNPTAAALVAAAPPDAIARPVTGSAVRVFSAPPAAADTAITFAAAEPSAVQWVRLLSAVAGRLERSSTLFVLDGDVGGTATVRVLTASPVVAAAARLALGRLSARAPAPDGLLMVAAGGLPGDSESVARRYGVAPEGGGYVAVYGRAGLLGLAGAEQEVMGGLPLAAAVRDGIAAVVAPSLTSYVGQLLVSVVPSGSRPFGHANRAGSAHGNCYCLRLLVGKLICDGCT